MVRSASFEKTLIKSAQNGDERALARLLSLIESRGKPAELILDSVFSKAGNSFVLGITGAPGVGKSTLVDKLAVRVASANRVGVIAIDPTSPFTGGALLGDRIRMSAAASAERVYIRSMATRGALGGLSPSAFEAVVLLDAVGFDQTIIETVGVGQGEVEIVGASDCVIVVLVPGLGDSVQALKAGIMEIADIFVINKADHDGADRLEQEIKTVLGLSKHPGREPSIVRTVATTGKGLEELHTAIVKFREWSEQSGERKRRKEKFFATLFAKHLKGAFDEEIRAFDAKSGLYQEFEKAVVERKKSPAEASRELVKAFREAKL